MADDPKKLLTTSSPFSVWEQYAHGEIDPTGAPIVGDYDDPDVGFYGSAKEIQRRSATADTFKDVNFTKGLVLAVLSGPSANNDATTGGRLTKLLSVEGTRPWWEELSVFQGKTPQLRAIVKVFGLTPDLPMPKQWPPTARDEQIIALYPEYVAMNPDMDGLSEIKPGTLVRVQHDRRFQNNAGPLPVGTIVGVIGTKPADIREIKPSPKAGFKPKCAKPLRLAGAAGGNFVSHTVALLDPGHLAKKVKNKIPLGVFGEGNIQTKANFAQSLKLNNTSLINKISGQIEFEKNAFIWVGHMKNNGYLDYIDRPPDLGRETILFAPKYLDVESPIELKYYFHDQSGFGTPWVMGPGTTIDQAMKNAQLDKQEANDFAFVIAPAIKDLMSSGRNFILVIPEMMHSRGYGTPPTAHARISKLKTGQGAGAGTLIPYAPTARVNIESTAEESVVLREKMRELIDGYTLPSGFRSDGTPLPSRSLSTIQRWRERPYSTFDNSYTGGNFPRFHGEVQAVVEKYLGTLAKDNIDYVSIHAAGASIATLAAMSTYDGNESAFQGVPIDRVDLIDNIAYDSIQAAAQFGMIGQMGSSATSLGNRRPSVVFYENFVLPKANSGLPLEFNYFTRYDQKKTGGNNFFSDPSINRASEYEKHYKPSNSNSGRVMSFNNAASPQARNHTALWIYKNPLVRSLISVNDYVNPGSANSPYESAAPGGGAYQINVPPHMRDSIPRALNSEVPDHAGMAASKASSSRILDLQSEKQKLVGEAGTATNPEPGSKLHYFWSFLGAFSQRTQTNICFEPDYQVFCKKLSNSSLLGLDASDGSLLQSSYSAWYNDMKELAKIEAMIADALFLQWISDIAERGKKTEALNQIQKALTDSNTGVVPRLAKLKTPDFIKTIKQTDEFYSKFKKADWAAFDGQIGQIWTSLIMLVPGPVDQMPVFTGYVEEYVLLERKKQLEALQKLVNGLPDGPANAPGLEGCPSPPRALGAFGGGISVEGALTPGEIQCGSLPIPATAPQNYLEISSLIPFFPQKKDVMANTKHDKLMKVPGFKLAPIKHMTRRSNNNISYISSAAYGTTVWECLASKIQPSWTTACNQSLYIPFRIFGGYRKERTPNVPKGISLHDLGLAIDIDPSLNGQGADWTKGVFTNSWLAGPVQHPEIDALGVYADEASDLLDNVLEHTWFAGDEYRKTQDYDDAPGVYEEDLGEYLKTLHKSNIICPINSNPLLWVLIFCETSGMKWGNGTFMKKRYRGGKDWSQMEKNKLDRIFNIPNVVDRVRAISWARDDWNDHMHFQFYDGNSYITYEEIAEAARLSGVDYGL